MKIKDLKSQHPEYDVQLLTKYELLYEGGHKFLEQVVLFLPKRAAEGMKLYNERLSRAFYIGYVGPVIDYFTSNLFAFNANINLDKAKSKSIKAKDNPFYGEFLADSDRKGSDFNQFFKEVFTQTLIHQQSFILIDFPLLDPDSPPPQNYREQEAAGLLRAYMVHFTKQDLIDWQYDAHGNYEWMKFYTTYRYKESYDQPEVIRHRWYIYDKLGFIIYQFDEDKSRNEAIDQKDAMVVAQGPHSLPGHVPIYSLAVSKGLWVMNKLASVQMELFNLDNALAWQEYQGHYAMPIVKLKDGKDFKQKMGESYYIKLETEESFEWAEPEGRMMEVGLKRREMLKDEMFRIIHQLSLSVKQTKSQTRQSGNSKQEDRHATEVVLRAFGDIIRVGMQSVLNWISQARQDEIEWDVSGFNTFDTESTTEKLAQVLQLRAINIHSETFNKELEKRTVDYYLEDSNQETKEQIKKEIDDYDFSMIISDPLAAVFSRGSFEGGGYMKDQVPGSSKPAQQGQKPNNTHQKSAGAPKS
jgi:hypothetical protein